MLRKLNRLFGYELEARDGRLGKVDDLYFDDHVWRIRYLVAKTGGWLARKHVLISTVALEAPRASEECFPVKLTQEQVRNSPDIDTDQPVSRQMEESLGLYYGWPSYWLAQTGAMLSATPSMELAAAGPATMDGVPAGDPHLRSVRDVSGYKATAMDADEELEVGTVEDFIAEDEDWTIRYVLIRTESDDNAKEVVLNPWWSREIDWTKRTMRFDLRVAQIRSSPLLECALPLDRDFEARLHGHYERPPYWQKPG